MWEKTKSIYVGVCTGDKVSAFTDLCRYFCWWRCHRRIVADYLLATGKEVFHIMNEKERKIAEIMSAARMVETGALRYSAE